MQDAGYRLTELILHLVDGHETFFYTGTQQYSQHTVALQTNLVNDQLSSLERE